MTNWNPWHGCKKYSAGCQNCYVYRIDERHGKDSSIITKTQNYNLPLKKTRKGGFKVPAGSFVYTCFSSDFFLEEADVWRGEAWGMMKYRGDINFFFTTKRILRAPGILPKDWGPQGYPNVQIACTVENEQEAQKRLPVYKNIPQNKRVIICEPLLGPINLRPYLGPDIEMVIAGGESGPLARICDYKWILDIRQQCLEAGVEFYFKQTGAKLFKDGRLYNIERRRQHEQALKAGINLPDKKRSLFQRGL